MRKFCSVFLLLLFCKGLALAQPNCAGAISFTVGPAPVNGTYAPGTVVNYCFTMSGYTQGGTNWFEGFDINLGPGWLPGSITPVSPPANCGGGGGSWIWLNASTATTPPFLTFGPGYFFDLNGNGIAGDDFGDAGSCTWTFCFNVTVGNTVGASLSVGVAPLSDGIAGSWNSGACDGVNYSYPTPGSVVVGGNCTLTGSITSQTNVLCFGASTGAAVITGSLGTAPYTYSFAGGAFTANNNFSNLAAGNYTVTIQDAAGCTHNVALNITQPATGLTGNLVSQTNVDCFGNATGSMNVSASTGVPPYTFGLNGGPQSASTSFSNLTAGNYVVNISDASGCTANLNVTITEPNALTINTVNLTDVDCFGNATGEIEIAANGGTAPYTFSFNGVPSGNQTIYSNLASGNYTIDVVDANNCTATLTLSISQPAAPLGIQLVNNTPVDCFGASTGEISVAGIDGTAPYQYSLFGGVLSASGVISNLAAGTYIVVVEDANGCTSSLIENVTQPAAALSVALSTQSNVLCFGGATGSLTFSAQDGTPAYTYSLSGNSNASGVFNNLSAGNYTVTATDANGCTAQSNATLNQPNAALGGFVLTQTNVLCSGTSTGSFEILGSNGTPPYTFTNNGVTNSTGVFSNLAAGIYNVTITDQNGCTFIQQVNLTSPNALSSAIANQTSVSCFGGNDGAVTVNGVNGTGPYTFTLNGNTNANGVFGGLSAGNYSVLVTDQNGCTVNQAVTISQPLAALSGSIANQINVSCNGLSDASISITASGGTPAFSFDLAGTVNNTGSFSGLALGNYQVIITDANNCTTGVPVLITQPNVLSISLSNQTNVSCFGGNNGQINVSGAGGTAPNNFSIGGSNNTTGSFNGLTAGNYNVVITDQNNCTAGINVQITEPAAALSVSVVAQTNVICFGANTGSVTLAGNGGTPAWQYGITGTALSPSATINGLAAGNYSFTVQDANGCTSTTTTIITQPAQPIQMSLLSQTDILCFGGNTGSIEVSASNGTLPFSYALGATTNATGIFNNLTSGLYSVVVTDANNCTQSIQVNLLQPVSPIAISVVTQQNPVCNGFSNGSIEVIAQGGTAPAGYNYSWNTVPAVGSAQLMNVPAGAYTVTVTDGNACTQSLQVTLTQPNFQVNVIGSFSLCKGEDSLMTFSSLDGAPPVTYALTNLTSGGVTAGAQQNILPLLTANYQVVATDNNGCISPPMNFTITVNDVPEAVINADINVGCQPVCVNFSANPGPAGTIFNWSLGDGTAISGANQNHCYNEVGSFEVGLQAVSPAGCTSFVSIPDYIVVHEIPLVDFSASPRVINLSNALISFDNNTNPEYTFEWDFGDKSGAGNVFSPTHTYLNPGEYCILLSAENSAGCKSEQQECVTILPDFQFFIPNSFTPNGDGVNDTFYGSGVSVGHQDLKIYSRWGNLVFSQSSSGTIEWDGVGFDQDAYTYHFIITDIFGKSIEYTGSVTLLR